MDQGVEAELTQAGLELREDAEGLILEGDGMRLRAGFDEMRRRILPGMLNRELLVRACKVKGIANPTLFDATAGLGQDSLLLAAAGFTVTLYECNPVIALLLADAVERARLDSQLAEAASRMHVVEGDSVAALHAFDEPVDVIYLDPMFPERTKSAAVKKKFQLLHQLEAPCRDELELLDAALGARPRKVVIKRPIKGTCLGGAEPDYALRGKAVRYDCFVIARDS